MLVAIQDESFFEAVFAKTNLESAGAVGDFNWHLMLPTSARVSPLTYSAVVATRYVALYSQQAGKWAIGTGGYKDLPSGFQTVLWYAGWNRKGPGCAYAVSSMLRTLLSHQDWGQAANESLYIMCNNLEDVKTLDGDLLMKRHQGQVRCDTVASSASTTARVAAVIQRGGSFLSGSFVNKSWAEDAAGRSTVCLTRSISYTVLISSIEMMGMVGMAQVIGAKTYGVEILPPDPAPWSPPLVVLKRTDQELMQNWSIDQPPQWADIPLAILEPTEGHEPKRQRRQQQEVVHRLRLTLAWTFTHPVLRKFQNNILEAASNNWLSVPRQRLQPEDPFLYAVVWAYALDTHKSPTFLVIPIDA